MSLTRARYAVRAVQYGCPLVCLIVAAAALEGALSAESAAVAVLAVAGAVWLLLRAGVRWLAQATREQEDIDRQLIQSQKTLALGEISTGIAHEINNPLNIILQEAELIRVNLGLLDSPETRAEMVGSVNVIFDQVGRCSDITHKLLDFARSRKTVAQYADINRLMDDMLLLVERDAAPRNIRVIRLFDESMPRTLTDPPLLRQVFLNILINAVQAVRKDGRIIVTTYYGKDKVCAEVRDTGPGIPPEDWERIFNPFYTTKQPGEGTGLGLAVSLRIINELGGTITVDAPMDKPMDKKGARFTVCIPRKNGDDHDDHDTHTRSG